MSSPTCFADEIRDQFEAECEIADILLRDIILRDQTPTYAELVALQQKMGWDNKEVQRQLRRMHGVLRQQGIAGSPADREASAEQAATAAAVSEKEVPKLDEQIAKLQAKRDALERDKRLTAKRCDEQKEAVLQLREHVPVHIRKKVSAAVGAIEATIGRQILDIAARINEIECCLDPSRHRDNQAYLELLHRSFRPAVTVDAWHKRVLSAEWPAIKAEIQRELAELKEQIEPLKVQRKELTEQAELPLDYYSDPKNWEN